MIYAITTLLALLTGLGAWIYKLVSHNNELKAQVLLNGINTVVKEYDTKLAQQQTTIKEDERNYADAKKRFDSNNPPSGAV